jgi:hypothetical protein
MISYMEVVETIEWVSHIGTFSLLPSYGGEWQQFVTHEREVNVRGPSF